MAASALAACAQVAGLDGLVEEDDCTDGCADAAPMTQDSGEPPDVGADHVVLGDAGGLSDTGTREDVSVDASTSDVSVSDDGASLDAEAPDTSMPDASTDAASPDASAPDASAPDASAPDASFDAAPDAPPDAAGPCGTVYLSEPFSNNAQGWTLDTSWSIAATCASPPTPQKGYPDPTTDHTAATTDNGVAGAFVCGNNPASTTNPARYLTSPVIDTAGAASLKLTFYRWLNSDSAAYMASTVDVYNGTAWVNLYTNPTGSGSYVTDDAWTVFEYDLGAYANAAMRVRFGYSVLSTSVYEMSSWNVDDVTVSTLVCP
jgi:hypothetical protein